jgi:hypothetical protein
MPGGGWSRGGGSSAPQRSSSSAGSSSSDQTGQNISTGRPPSQPQSSGSGGSYIPSLPNPLQYGGSFAPPATGSYYKVTVTNLGPGALGLTDTYYFTSQASYQSYLQAYNQYTVDIQNFYKNAPSGPPLSVSYALKNPFAAKSFLGGLMTIGEDVQNTLARSALGWSQMAQDIQASANQQKNPVVSAIETFGAGLAYEGSGFVESLAITAGKPASGVPWNPATVAGGLIGFGIQAYFGGEAIGAAKGALGISSLRGGIAFSGGAFGGLSAATTAAQGGSPVQIAESGLAGFGTGALGELVSPALGRILMRGSGSAAMPRYIEDTSFLTPSYYPRASFEEKLVPDLGTPTTASAATPSFIDRGGMTLTRSNILPYIGRFARPEGVIPPEEGGIGDAFSSPKGEDIFGNAGMGERSSLPTRPFSSYAGEQAISNAGKGELEDSISSLRGYGGSASTVNKDLRSSQSLIYEMSEPPLSGYESGIQADYLREYEQRADIGMTRASSLGLAPLFKNLITEVPFQPTLGGIQPSLAAYNQGNQEANDESRTLVPRLGWNFVTETVPELSLTPETSVTYVYDYPIEARGIETAVANGFGSPLLPIGALSGITGPEYRRSRRKHFRGGIKKHRLSKNVLRESSILSISEEMSYFFSH